MARVVSIGRDNIVRMAYEQDFFEKNPAFAPLEEDMKACNQAFYESGRKAGCHCRADTKLLVPCITKFIDILETAKTNEDAEIINTFVRHIAKSDDIAHTTISVYFRALDGGDEMKRYEYTEIPTTNE